MIHHRLNPLITLFLRRQMPPETSDKGGWGEPPLSPDRILIEMKTDLQ
jgi:hypothetical protein